MITPVQFVAMVANRYATNLCHFLFVCLFIFILEKGSPTTTRTRSCIQEKYKYKSEEEKYGFKVGFASVLKKDESKGID